MRCKHEARRVARARRGKPRSVPGEGLPGVFTSGPYAINPNPDPDPDPDPGPNPNPNPNKVWVLFSGTLASALFLLLRIINPPRRGLGLGLG